MATSQAEAMRRWEERRRREAGVAEPGVTVHHARTPAEQAGPGAMPLARTPLPEGCDEATFQAHVVGFARDAGWRVYHTRNSRGSDEGYPDLVLARGRRKIAAELKRDDVKSVPVAQVLWLLDLARTGDEAYLWRPRDMAAIEVLLR